MADLVVLTSQYILDHFKGDRGIGVPDAGIEVFGGLGLDVKFEVNDLEIECEGSLCGLRLWAGFRIF
jgi:hypothetical protein